MSKPTNRGFIPVLTNPHFRALWIAQLLAQTSQHAIHFIQMVLIEQLTGSTVHLGFTILAFTLPGVLFSPVAGVIVDRFPKKWVLVTSNLARVLLVSSYLLVLSTLHGTWEVLAIYVITFCTATLAQFFSPAEASTIPLLVGEDRLMEANSLFTLTMALSQVAGLLILGPLAVSLLKVQGGFVMIALMYLGAAILVSTIPKDRHLIGAEVAAPRVSIAEGLSGWRRMWVEFKEGLQFVTSKRKLKAAMTHLVTITTLVMVMAMIAPGYAARVLGMAPENAVIVFAPAGVGMLLATGIVGRWGHVLRRAGFAYVGLVLVGLTFGAMGLLSLDYQRLLQPILRVYPQAAFSLTSATMALGFVLGLCMSSVNILAQTVLQQESPAYIRGRVFSVQFMLNNIVGIPPMLALGGIADAIGIPRVLEVVGLAAVLLAIASIFVARADFAIIAIRRQALHSGQFPAEPATQPRPHALAGKTTGGGTRSEHTPAASTQPPTILSTVKPLLSEPEGHLSSDVEEIPFGPTQGKVRRKTCPERKPALRPLLSLSKGLPKGRRSRPSE